MISLSLPSDLPEAENINILNEREHILSKKDFEKTTSIKNILAELGLTEEQYLQCITHFKGF